MDPPVPDMLFHLDGKLSSGADNILCIEAIRFSPLNGVTTALTPLILGTGLYLGRPEDGLFNLKCTSYANGSAAEVLIDCYHSTKQYQNVAKIIQKNQEVFCNAFLHYTDSNTSVVL